MSFSEAPGLGAGEAHPLRALLGGCESTHATVPRVLTTIHWMPSAKDLCRSRTHLKRKAVASAPGEGGQVTPPRRQPRSAAGPRGRLPGGKHVPCRICRAPRGGLQGKVLDQSETQARGLP